MLAYGPSAPAAAAGAGQEAPGRMQTALPPYKGYMPGLVRLLSGGGHPMSCRQAAFTIRPPSSQAPVRSYTCDMGKPSLPENS